MPGIKEKLMTWLDKVIRKPLVYGQSDCMLDIADWLDASCGLNAAAAWRNRYSNLQELDALLEPLGGFEAAMRAEAARLGLQETQEPKMGDVALVRLAGQDKPAGGILMPSGRWRIRTENGIRVTREDEVVVAWKLPWPG